MPAKKKIKKKKVTLSSFGRDYVDIIKNRDNLPKQKKINKLMMKPDATKADRKFLAMLLADAGKGMENFDKPATPVSPYKIAKEIKNYRELQGFVERFAGGMHEKEIAKLILDHVQTKVGFNRWKILENDNLPYVWTLLSAIDKNPRQAVGVYEIYKKNPTSEVRNPLRKFEVRTSYVVPTSVISFQADLTRWKKLLNVARTGNYRTGVGSSEREFDSWKWNETLKAKK